jgi:hypothetical protein
MRLSESFSKQCLHHGAWAAAKRLDAPRACTAAKFISKHASDPDNKARFFKSDNRFKESFFCVFVAPLSVPFEEGTQLSTLLNSVQIQVYIGRVPSLSSITCFHFATMEQDADTASCQRATAGAAPLLAPSFGFGEDTMRKLLVQTSLSVWRANNSALLGELCAR